MAAVSRHWPEELGGGRVGENGAEPVEDWGLVGKDRNQVSGGKGGRGAGGTKAQGGKEGRLKGAERGSEKHRRRGKGASSPLPVSEGESPLCLLTKPFLPGLPSNSPAQLRSDEEAGNLSGVSLGPDQKDPISCLPVQHTNESLLPQSLALERGGNWEGWQEQDESERGLPRRSPEELSLLPLSAPLLPPCTI